MRRSGSWVALLGLLAPVAAMAAVMPNPNQAPARTYVRPSAAITAPTYVRPGAVVAMPPLNDGRSGSAGMGGRDHGSRHFRHRSGVQFVYASMYAPPGTAGDDQDDEGPVRTEYVQVPYPVPVAAPAPRPPPPVVRYATTGEPIDIPKGARVTTGSVYGYKQNGVSVYTDAPPASAHATLLFGYTEAVAPASADR